MVSPIDEIKNRLDIVEVIGSYIKLKKAGANYRALCPFHSEKKPSFFVSPSRQIWHCFGCSAGGDVFGFIKQIEGVEFGDALRILAKRAGVTLRREDPQLKSQRNRLYEISELACQFFEKQLEQSKMGGLAQKYLLERGIRKESFKNYRLGYAPDSWRGLSDFLASKGYRPEEIIKAGLAIRKENIGETGGQVREDSRGWYDRFRARIMFPVFDLNSQVIGFGGRIFSEGLRAKSRGEEEAPKYMNTPGTLLYDKSRILYNLDKARMAIRKNGFCILVEGYIDVILSCQLGFENIVATSGTALTNYQLGILKRYSDNLLTSFDMDVAGNLATKRGIDLAQVQGFNIKVIVLPAESDPAIVISKDPREWEKLIKNAKSILEFYFDLSLSRFDKDTLEGKKEISKTLLPVIKRIQNKIEQSFWIQELSRALQIKEEAILKELEKIKLESPQVSPEFVAPSKKSRKELLEERIAMLALKEPKNLDLISKEEIALFANPISRLILHLKTNPPGQIPELKELVDELSLKFEVEQAEAEIDIESEFKKCLDELKALGVKKRLNEISGEIKKAESQRDFSRLGDLIEKFNLLTKKIKQ